MTSLMISYLAGDVKCVGKGSNMYMKNYFSLYVLGVINGMHSFLLGEVHLYRKTFC
jgi:hypothetical protein